MGCGSRKIYKQPANKAEKMAGERKIIVLGREYSLIELDSVPKVNKAYGTVSGKKTVDEIASQFERRLRENYALLSSLPQDTACLIYKTGTGLEGVLTTDIPKDYLIDKEFEEWLKKQKAPLSVLIAERSKLDLSRSIRHMNEAQMKEMLKKIYITHIRTQLTLF